LNQGDPSIELTAQNAYIRRLQHQLAQRYNLASRSTGREPYRRVRIFRDEPGEEWPADEPW
jgi:predicted RNA-binding protein Jag